MTKKIAAICDVSPRFVASDDIGRTLSPRFQATAIRSEATAPLRRDPQTMLPQEAFLLGNQRRERIELEEARLVDLGARSR